MAYLSSTSPYTLTGALVKVIGLATRGGDSAHGVDRVVQRQSIASRRQNVRIQIVVRDGGEASDGGDSASGSNKILNRSGLYHHDLVHSAQRSVFDQGTSVEESSVDGGLVEGHSDGHTGHGGVRDNDINHGRRHDG